MRYFLPVPYLVVEADREGRWSADIRVVADSSRQFRVQPFVILAKQEAEMRPDNQKFRPDDRRGLALATNGLNPRYEELHPPGRSNFVGEGVKQWSPSPSASRRHRGGLVLSAELGKESYLVGEPLVVALEVRCNWGEAEVRPELDPGFGALRVWYETPRGERRLSRPFMRFCQGEGGLVKISGRNVLRHHPRVFVGARGLTFREPGLYRLWAEFGPSAGGVARGTRSGTVEFEIRRPVKAAELEICGILADSRVARFLAQKGGPLSRGRRQRLRDVTCRHFRHEALGGVRYAMASELYRNGRAAEADTPESLEWSFPMIPIRFLPSPYPPRDHPERVGTY